LIPWIREDLVEPEVVIDVKGIDGLNEITLKDDSLVIGSLVTFSDLIDSEKIRTRFPLVFEAARLVGSVGIRNRATMVGNICSAVPSCDSGPVLLVHEAVVLSVGSDGERAIPIGDWFVGPKRTSLGTGRMVTSITLPLPRTDQAGSYVKLGRYNGEDLAQASVAVLAMPGNVYRVAFGAVAPTPVRSQRIESFLAGREPSDSVIDEAKKLVGEETSPIGDVRSSREYRRHMLEVMFERGLRAAAARLGGEGPAYGA
jgi:carbon-monoxide dehydrogenase medium subunit